MGRAETAVKVEIPIAHGTTSTRHAIIRADGAQLSITDLKSTNGTYQNGKRLTPNQPVMIQEGDKLRFGGYTAFVIATANRQ